jgi:hypothetical protein
MRARKFSRVEGMDFLQDGEDNEEFTKDSKFTIVSQPVKDFKINKRITT